MADQLRESRRHVDVLGHQEPFAALENRHVGAEAREDVTHLRGDGAAADDDHRGRQVVDAHDVVGGEVAARARGPGSTGRTVASRRRRRCGVRSAARRRPRAPWVRRTERWCGTPRRRTVPGTGPRASSVGSSRPKMRSRIRGQSTPSKVARTSRWAASRTVRADVGGDHVHLRRDAATVQARAAELVLLDDRALPALELRAEHHVAAAGTDDDQVVFAHPASLVAPASGTVLGASCGCSRRAPGCSVRSDRRWTVRTARWPRRRGSPSRPPGGRTCSRTRRSRGSGSTGCTWCGRRRSRRGASA